MGKMDHFHQKKLYNAKNSIHIINFCEWNKKNENKDKQ